MKYLFVVDAGIGVLMIFLAIPMALRMVRPNRWYGFRTTKTLSSEEIWYPANRYAGKVLLLVGITVVVFSLVLYWIVDSTRFVVVPSDALISILALILLFAPLVVCVIASSVHLRRL